MRKRILFLGLIMLAIPMGLQARSYSRNYNNKADNYHFGYISAAAGYSSLSQNINTAKPKGGLGYLIGAGYEFRHTSFWLSVGAQYVQEKSQTKLEQDLQYGGGIDDQGRNVTYYRYTTHQTDVQILRSIDVPIMLGYYYEGFYVGAGAKIGFDIGSKITVDGGYEFSAQYQRTKEEFHDVNYYKSYDLPSTAFACNLRPQFSLIGEIGYDLLSSVSTNSSICHILKIGFYFEYGLRSIRGQQMLDPISINGVGVAEAKEKQYDMRKATLNPYYMSTNTANARVVPYFVGAKLTYMIGGNRYASGTWHKGCMCYQ